MQACLAAILGAVLMAQPAALPEGVRIRLLTGSVALPAGCRNNTLVATDTITGTISCPNGGTVSVEGGSLMPPVCDERYEGSMRYLVAGATRLRSATGYEIALCVRGDRRHDSKHEFVAMIPEASTALIADLRNPHSVAAALEIAGSFNPNPLGVGE